MSTNTNSETDDQYTNAERLLPMGDLLDDIRGTDRAVRAIYVDGFGYEAKHIWVMHTASEFGEFYATRLSGGSLSSSFTDLEGAIYYLTRSEYDTDGRLVLKDTVPAERTPLPYHHEPTVHVYCPDCDRFGQTHPWKLEDYLDAVQPCECGFGGEKNVEYSR